MSGCLLWLIMLPFTTVPVPHHYSEEGMHDNKTSWVVGVIQGLCGGCLPLLFLSSSIYTTLYIMKVCICSFPSSLTVSPLQTDTCLYKGLPAEIRHAERCVENPPQDLHPQPLGTHLGCFWTFPQFTHTLAVESLMTQSPPYWSQPQEAILF